MWPFKRAHKHKRDSSLSGARIKCSLVTGVSVHVSNEGICSCGEILYRELTSAGYQQLDWGAEYNSLFGEGPIIVRQEKTEELENTRRVFWESINK